MKIIRLGIIGLGTVYEFQMQSLKTQEAIEIIALCDKDEHKAIKESDRIGVLYYTNVDQILANKDINTILLSTPVLSHFELGIKILQSRKHLLLEKPATLSLSELSDLHKTATHHGVLFIVAYHAIFAKDVMWFKNKYESELINLLGPITGIECQFSDPYITDGTVDKRALPLVGSWVDSGINALSVISQFVDSITLKKKGHLLINSNEYPATNMSSVVNYEAEALHEQTISVTVKTDWLSTLDLKKSTLYFNHTKHKIILHHSDQKVIMFTGSNEAIVLADFSSLNSRLVTQYNGLFYDFVRLISNNEDNYKLTYKLHFLLLNNLVSF